MRKLDALDVRSLDPLIFACVRTKLAVVAADERDGGLRQVLNLGHTVGHAIESASGYARYRHGEAVGLGLLAALDLSDAGELRGEVEVILRRFGLPVQDRSRRSRSTRFSRRSAATRSAPPMASASSCARRRADASVGQLIEPNRVRDAVKELY